MAAASVSAAASTSSDSAAGKKAVVVGAGPAGALTAMLLARQGFRVDVFERLAPLVGRGGEVRASIGPRSHHILLTERAITALEGAGADLQGFDIPDLAYGLRHRLRGAPHEGRRSTLPGRLKVANRGTLAGALVQQCLAQHGSRVQFHFNQDLHLLDPVNRTAYFRAVDSAAKGAAMASSGAGAGGGCGCGPDPTNAPAPGEAAQGGAAGSAAAEVQALTTQRTPASADALASFKFDLLVAADGASSLVRRVVQRHDKELAVRLTRDTMEFKVCDMGPADDFLPAGVSPVGTFQTWSNSKLQASLVGGSSGDGRLRCAFILPGGEHDKLQSAEDYERALAHTFPSLPQHTVKHIAPQLAACPVSNGGTIVRCSKLHSGRVVLVGDAAHSVYPALGQGANAALEGAATLGAVLAEAGAADLEGALAEYSRCWLPNAHAVADLTEDAFGGNAREFTLNLKLVQLVCQMLLHRVLPFLVPKPALLLINTTMPYAAILRRGQREMAAFKALLAAAAAALLAVLVRHARPSLTALGLV